MKQHRAVAALGCVLLSSCVPWTVRPIEDKPGGAFDAQRYVDTIWNAKVLPAAAAQAVDLAEWLHAGRRDQAPVAILVKGEGKVLRVDTGSRSGMLMLDLAPYDGRADAALQIGPVMRGTALRDALPFIQFSQFVNQLEFARVGNALNDHVAKTVLTELPKDGLTGSVVAFTGAATLPPGGGIPEIVPVTLAVKRDRA